MVGKTYKIYLFRHGQTHYNKNKIFTGWKDSKLTSLGEKQAQKIAKILKNKKFKTAFYTKLSRSKDTLKLVLKYHPECKTKIQDNRMIERSYGDLEGVSHKGFINKIGKQVYNLRMEGDAIENLEPKLRKKAERFLGEKEYNLIHRGWDTPPKNGESFKMVEKRVEKFIEYLKKFIKENKTNIAISAHGNSIRLFRKIWEKATISQATKWFIPYDKVFTYKVKV